MKKILIAVDSRENSIIIAQKGFQLADQLHAEAALIFVIDKSKAIGNPDAGIMPNDALTVLKKEAQATMEQLIHLNNRPFSQMKFMPEGSPNEDILQTADDWEADAIVIGINGKSGFTLWAMGSITQHIILHSKIPVIVIPAKSDSYISK